MKIITSRDYRSARIKRGNQIQVAKALNVSTRTIKRRESGKMDIAQEAWRALISLPLLKSMHRFREVVDKVKTAR